MRENKLARGLRQVGFSVAVVVAVITARPAHSEPLAQPSDVGPLPDLQGAAKVGALLSKPHVDLYKKVLVPEVADLIRNGDLVVEVALQPKRKDLFSATKGGSASLVAIDRIGALQPAPEVVLGQILADVADDGQDADRTQQAYGLLWNAAIHAWRLKSLSINASLTTFATSSGEAKRVDFLVQRIYPRALGVSPGTLTPLFREKISAIQPPVLKGLTWLTLRFHGADDDYLWAASPITGQSRQLTGSNRADPFFSAAFSPDDLWVWSGKIERVQPTSLSSMQLLVPVVETGAKVQAQGDCSVVEYGKGEGIETNLVTKRYSDAPGWVPSTIRMVLRNVTRIDLESRDPFSVDAQQSVYLDSETALPVYKTVRGIDGTLKKVVMGVIGSVGSQDGVMPGWRGEVVFTPQTSGHSVLSINRIETCSKMVPGREIKNFDPSAIGAKQKDSESKGAKAPSPKSEPETIEPVDE
jgi:hypothetical protein